MHEFRYGNVMRFSDLDLIKIAFVLKNEMLSSTMSVKVLVLVFSLFFKPLPLNVTILVVTSYHRHKCWFL